MTLYSTKGGTSLPYVYIFLENINKTVYTSLHFCFFSESTCVNVATNCCSWEEKAKAQIQLLLTFLLKDAVLRNIPLDMLPVGMLAKCFVSGFAVYPLIIYWLKSHSCALQVTWSFWLQFFGIWLRKCIQGKALFCSEVRYSSVFLHR